MTTWKLAFGASISGFFGRRRFSLMPLLSAPTTGTFSRRGPQADFRVCRSVMRMNPRLFEPTMFVGVGVLALWAYVRLPRLRPGKIQLAIPHIVLSFGVLHLAPILVHVAVHSLSAPLSVIVAIGLITVPTLCYFLLSWVWLLACLRDFGPSTPRGGHPAPAGKS
jgi:hypothetical protein